MKAYFYLFFLALSGILFASSCKKSNVAYEKEFNKSYKSWVSFKASSANSYRYTVITSSWTGHSSETTITIKDGKAVQRSYVAKGIDQANQVAILEEWDEDESSLASHPKGFVPLTLDEIYQKAKAEWLTKKGNADTYFETKNNGMISMCGFSEHGCQDDCFRGIHIKLIEKL